MSDAPRKLILVVEDDPGVAMLQRRRLERAGFGVDVANDVDAAMSTLGAHTVDLVLMDYRLGQTTGLDLHRRMIAAGHDVPVILVSAAVDDATVIEAMRAGIRDVVVKTTEYLDYLPETVRGVLNQAAALPDRSATERHDATILIVEDEIGIATLERRRLERAGYAVEVATSAEQAFEIVRRGRTNLALLDLRLESGTSGIDLYERFKAEGWNIPAILVTGFPDQAVAIRALRAGIRDFVPKSNDFLDHLPTAVDRVVAQMRVERRLVESELRLASVIGTTMDAILMCDQDLHIVLFNPSAEQMFACSAASAIGQRLERFIPDLVADLGDASSLPLTENMRRRLEVDGLRSDGQRLPIEVSISDVVIYERRLFTVIARDVTERRRIELELREADRRKDEFLGMLAHELRNPLAAIMTAGEVLHRKHDPSQAKLIAVVRRQTRALARMVDDLLDVSRVTLGKIQLAREPLLLSELVTRAADTVRDRMHASELAFAVRVDDDPVWLAGDATRLEQVLTNLLSNAAKFTPPGGRVTLDAAREGNEAVIRVRDTGYGIEPTLLPRVFDLFVQGDTSLDRSKSGLGIGLALVRQVVTLHGGKATAHSAGAGKGSEFLVRLPTTSDADESAAMPEEISSASIARDLRMNVLVVDDQRDIAESVASLIQSVGHHADAVYDGTAALASTRRRVPDVMLVDIGMPGMTGYELAHRVRRDPALTAVRLVALTGYGRDEDRARAKEAGFDLHVTKPVSALRLQELLASLGRAPIP